MRIGNATYEGTPSTRPEEGMVSDQDGRSRIMTYIISLIKLHFALSAFPIKLQFQPYEPILALPRRDPCPFIHLSDVQQPAPTTSHSCDFVLSNRNFQYCQLLHKQHLASLDVEGCLLVALRIPSFHIERDRRRLLPLWTNTSTLDRHLHISGPDKQQTVGGHRRQLLDRLATT